MEQVQKEGKRIVTRNIMFYNLDVVIAVGYRINSVMGTKFRQWATQVLKQHISEWFTINKQYLEKNYQKFLHVVEDIQALLPKSWNIKNKDVLELIKAFSHTWFQLDAYDTKSFPEKGNITTKTISTSGDELYEAITSLKNSLIEKWEATTLFAQEKTPKSVEGILWNILQSFDGQELYPTLEQKAAHLLYFMTKNHPFTDGNKRSAALSFIWFLGQNSYSFRDKISPETLSVLTLFIAESDPQEKEKIIGLILLILS